MGGIRGRMDVCKLVYFPCCTHARGVDSWLRGQTPLWKTIVTIWHLTGNRNWGTIKRFGRRQSNAKKVSLTSIGDQSRPPTIKKKFSTAINTFAYAASRWKISPNETLYLLIFLCKSRKKKFFPLELCYQFQPTVLGKKESSHMRFLKILSAHWFSFIFSFSRPNFVSQHLLAKQGYLYCLRDSCGSIYATHSYHYTLFWPLFCVSAAENSPSDISLARILTGAFLLGTRGATRQISNSSAKRALKIYYWWIGFAHAGRRLM